MVDLPPQNQGIGALLTQLVEDAHILVRAEVALYRAQIFAWIAQARSVAILAVAALMLVNCAVIALFVGMLLILQPRVGPILATIIVVTGTLLIAGLFGWLAARRVRKLIAARSGK